MGDYCDPYPQAGAEILGFAAAFTNISASDIKPLPPESPEIFEYPLLLLACRRPPAALSEKAAANIRAHLSAGGTLWVEDASGGAAFDGWVRENLGRIFPDGEPKTLPPEHAVYRSFFLIKKPQGRARLSSGLEGIDRAGRAAVVYSRNDLLGVWPCDALGKPLYPITSGAVQTGKRLTLNILMYALTGTYKLDAVHQPALLRPV